jgi:Calcineurin-like phosphoesterase/Bacterial Ig domain
MIPAAHSHAAVVPGLISSGAVPKLPGNGRARSMDRSRPLTAESEVSFADLSSFPSNLDNVSVNHALTAILPPTPPTISITSPTNGAILSPGDVTITTDPRDEDGYVYRVALFAEGAKIGAVSQPPFDFVWTNVPTGRYALQAQAFDNSGRFGLSDLVHVQVGQVSRDRLLRGPYLQMATPTNLVLRWRTDWFTATRVCYGADDPLLPNSLCDPNPVLDHEIRLEGLTPNTKYFYGTGTAQELLARGPDCFFITPPSGPKRTRVWVIGDSGTANDNARAVRDAYLTFARAAPADLWLMLGDNAYEDGTDAQYQEAVFNLYPTILRQTVLWPTIGNHDAAYDFGHGIPYQDIFTLPRRGECGGLASGTENYYAFDYANIHFVCLDSQISDRSPAGPMLTWLENDLAATAQDWIVAFWHHPPYSKGPHDSDLELELIQMREWALPILERFGADLVLCGHSHDYERSLFLQGYYGLSTDLDSHMILDAGSGRPEETGPYRKPAGGLGANQGTVYAVCGCSGEGGGIILPDHPAMFFSRLGFGSMILDIDGLRLDAIFLDDQGNVDDRFTVLKGPPEAGQRPALTIQPSSPPQAVTLSWPTSLTPAVLEHTSVPGPSADWVQFTCTPTVVGRRNVLTLPVDAPQKWFRLRADP